MLRYLLCYLPTRAPCDVRYWHSVWWCPPARALCDFRYWDGASAYERVLCATPCPVLTYRMVESASASVLCDVWY
eukprot:3940847-Rhodomonas_salina.6